MNKSFFDGKTAKDVLTHFELHPIAADVGTIGVLIGAAELALYALHYDSHTDTEWVYEHPVKVAVVKVDTVTKVLMVRTTEHNYPIPGLRMVGTFGLKYEPTVYQDNHLACGTENIDWHHSTRDKFGEDGEWQLREQSMLA